jgi:hypothetical protein
LKVEGQQSMEKDSPREVERVDTTTTTASQNLKDAVRLGEVKTTKVKNVAFADAIAKDNPKPWSKSMLKLYAIMALVTLSMIPIPFPQGTHAYAGLSLT